MDNAILIDVQISAVSVMGDSFEEVFISLLNFAGQKESLPPLEVNYSVLKTQLKDKLKQVTDSKSIWTAIILAFFGKTPANSKIASNIASIKSDWVNSSTKKVGVTVDSAFNAVFTKAVERYGKIELFVRP